ncbi:hypothetical protein PSKAS_22970 [Peribacillus sp. N1]
MKWELQIVDKFKRCLQALAFRGRSGSFLGAFAPAVSPGGAFPQESRTFRFINIDLKF